MFVVDDLLVRPFLFILDALHSMAIEELYDVEALTDELKENQLLYELGERSEAEYRERRDQLEAEIEIAETAREQLHGKHIEVQSR